MSRLTAVLASTALTMGIGISAARAQTIIHVDDDAPLGGDGTSWVTPFRYLQDAIGPANNGDEIRVAGGIYKPDQTEIGRTAPGDRSATFLLVDGVTIEGGYAGYGAADPDVRNVDLHETILSGDLTGDDQPDFTNNEENSYHVVTGSGSGPSAVLDGCTITAGHADGTDPYDRGAGIYNNAGSPTLIDCTVRECVAVGPAGGMANTYDSSPTLTGCTFQDNSTGSYGGGMFNWYNSSPTLTDCTFSGNSAYSDGGGMTGSGDPTLINCTFRQNVATYGGGGMFNWLNPAFTRWTDCDGMIRACFPCDSRGSGHSDRGIQWVTCENKHFVFSLMANLSSNFTERRSPATQACSRFVNWMKRSV